MTLFVLLAPWLLLAATAAGLFVGFSTRPGFAVAVVGEAFKLVLPSILKAVAPRERTQEEKARERAGQTIFGDRDRR